MKNLKLIGKVATFFGAISILFVVLGVIATYAQIAISGSTAPADYIVFYILSAVLPYLFVAALSLIVAVILRGMEKEELPVSMPVSAVIMAFLPNEYQLFSMRISASPIAPLHRIGYRCLFQNPLLIGRVPLFWQLNPQLPCLRISG